MRYHQDIGNGIPSGISVPEGILYINPSSHAVNASSKKKYLREDEDRVSIPSSVEVNRNNIFEVEKEQDKYTGEEMLKICVRKAYDEKRDIIFAILLDGTINDPQDRCTLKTIWINSTEDTYDTLDESLYDNVQNH